MAVPLVGWQTMLEAESMQGVQPQERLSAIKPRRKIGPAEIHQSGLASLSHPLASWIEAGGWLMYGIWRLFVDEEVRSFVLEGVDGFDHFRKLFLEFLNGVFADG